MYDNILLCDLKRFEESDGFILFDTDEISLQAIAHKPLLIHKRPPPIALLQEL